MMITIHGLAPKTKYQDLRLMIKQECNIDDFIMDNLVTDSDGTKKVRIGLPDENEGYKLMKSLSGYRMPGNFALKVVPVSKPAVNPSVLPQGGYDSRPGYQNQSRNDYPVQSRGDYNQPGSNDYNRPLGPRPSIPGSSEPRGPNGHNKPYGSGGPHSQGPVDSARPSPWTGNSGNSSQWTSNLSMAAQVPQNSFNLSGAQTNAPYAQQPPSQGAASRPELRSIEQGRQTRLEQNYGSFRPKNLVTPLRQPDLRQNLRAIDTLEGSSGLASMHGGRYPPNQYPSEKPGPTQYNISHPGGHQQPYQDQPAPLLWQQPPPQTLPTKPQFSKGGPLYDKGFTDRKYTPPDQSRDSKNQSRPETYKEYEKRRGFSPPSRDPIPRRSSPGRREDPIHRDPTRVVDISQRLGGIHGVMERRVSPSGRRDEPIVRRDDVPVRREDLIGRRDDLHARRDDAPGRRDEPHGRRDDVPMRREDALLRRDDPHGRRDDVHGRRDDPHARRYSPTRKRSPPAEDRRNIPGARQESPHRKLVSPSGGRRDERQVSRFSPVRHLPDKADKYGSDNEPKKVRPAYEPTSSHAPNQAMYSGGYRPNIHENVQYPVPGMRQEQPGPWQRHRDEPSAPSQKQEDERRDARMAITRERVDQVDKHFSAMRKSRPPNRSDRSPIQDRYKRSSQSPRSSYSPRRSWALEKRRSPDAPPPPQWPGQNNEQNRPNRSSFPEKEEKPKHQPVREPRAVKEEDIRNRRSDDQRQYEEAKIRIANDLLERPPVSHTVIGDRYQREPKFSPRDDYEERRDNYRRRESPDRKPHRGDFDLQRRPREDNATDDYNRRRESPRRERKPDAPKNMEKEFEDIYNRALQFKKKAEDFRKSESKKRDDFDDDRRISEKDREEIRQRLEERARHREEELLRLREREERNDDRLREERARPDRSRDDRLRDERVRDDRPHHDESHRVDYHSRDSQQHEREQDKPIDDNKAKRFFFSNDVIRQKRLKAIDDISNKIIDRNEEYKHAQGEQRQRILEELKVAVARIVYDMFGDTDVSFIEIIIKYQARYTLKDEAKILQDVMRSLPSQFRTIKRHAPEASAVPAKTGRLSPSADLKQDPAPRPKLSDSSFNVNLAPPSIISMPCIGIPQSQPIMHQSVVPMMVSAPFYQSLDTLQQNIQNQLGAVYAPKPVQPIVDFAPPIQPVTEYPQPVQRVVDFSQPIPPVVDFSQPMQPGMDVMPSHSEEKMSEGYRLYLCKDDFERITDSEADLLKDFLVSQMFRSTTQFRACSPDLTFKGLQSLYRYEVITKDESSRNWLVNLDFSEFDYFNVLVYTKEELWFERAAIWLPGHSRVKNIEPLDKLKLQNKKLEGVNISSWKFVKKIVNEKGTRVYVDMPPSSARALETHEMKLSYELQQVSVFLKAVAIDKDSFDAGLKESCALSSVDIAEAIKNAPVPSLANDPALVKIILKGSKSLDLVQARKIKEVVIYNLFRYHQQDGLSRTDFLKYGFLAPNYFAILPLNQESKRWLMGSSFGKVNRQAVVVIGGEDDNTRFFKMNATFPFEFHLRTAHIVERLKTSNQGVKGINFHLWKPIRIKPVDRKKARYEVEIDMQSLETLSTMRYQLDYVDNSGIHTVFFRSDYSQTRLEDMIKRCKAEMVDSYDVANMDLESDHSGSESSSDKVICLD